MLGTKGGIVSGFVWMTGSGRAAMATRLTAAAAIAPPVIPAVLKKSRLEFMSFPNQWPAAVLLVVLLIAATPAEVGRPISVACNAASVNQNCCSAAIAEITAPI